MNQHFLPESYLRRWCADGKLVRYRRLPQTPSLDVQEKNPRGVCWEQDLYRLPGGGVANGKTGDDIEHMLARQVDEKLPALLDAVGLVSGLLVEPVLRDSLFSLMDTLTARSSRAIARAEASTRDLIEKETPTIRRMLDRALMPGSKREIEKYLDPRMPSVAARAGLDAVVSSGSRLPKWQACQVHVVQSAEALKMLQALGLSAFPTYEEPVVEWDDAPGGFTASFSLSPDALALVIRGDPVNLSADDVFTWSLRHSIQPLSHRRSAICRRRAVEGHWLTRARDLQPWVEVEGPSEP